jgi:hypothetical protein
MRLSLKALFALMIAGVLFTACNKDEDDDKDDPKPVASAIQYNGQSYEIKHAILENYGEWNPGVYQLDLTLLNDGFTIHTSNGEIDSLSGTGSAIYFELFTTQSNALDNITYTLDTVNIGAAGTFDYGDILINFNMETWEGLWIEMSEGTLVVAKSGDTYEFTVNVKDAAGKTLTASYKGSVDYYNYDTKSGAPKANRRLWPGLKG